MKLSDAMESVGPVMEPYSRHVLVCTGEFCSPTRRGRALYSQLAAAVVLAPALCFVPAPPGPLSPLVAANVLALALASTAFAYLLYFRLIATIGPARALTVTFLIPLFGVLWGFLFLGEPLATNTLSGCALIVAGTWVSTRIASPHCAPKRSSDQGSA